jgi:tetratricopeptide (TPR) repeat protein
MYCNRKVLKKRSVSEDGDHIKWIVVVLSLVLMFSSSPAIGDQQLFQLTIICWDNYDFRMEYVQMIADEFEQVGIDVSVDYVNDDELANRCWGSEGKLYKDGGFDIVAFGWGLGTDGATAVTLRSIFHSDSSVTKNSDGNNIMSWENSENDALIEKIEAETDENKLRKYWLQWQELFYEELPLLPIYYYSWDEEGQVGGGFQHLSLNFNHPVLKEKPVRLALSHLVPRQRICNLHNKDEKNLEWPGYSLGQAEPSAVPVLKNQSIFNENLKPHRYDPEYAKELLFKAGYRVKTKKHEEAESLLQQADQAFKNFQFKEALDYATQAKQLYEDLEDTENISLTDDLISEYQNAADVEEDAQRLFDEGEQLKEQGEYEVAKESLLKAKEKFQSLGMTQQVSEVETVISEVEGLIYGETVTREADTLFNKGKEAFENGEYESALEYFQQAKEKYLSVGSEKAAECDQWVEKTQTELEKGFCLGSLFLVVLIGMGLAVLRKSR